MKPFSIKSKIGLKIMSWVRGYNHEKYWCRRSVVVDPNNKTPLLIKLYYLLYIKRKDAKFGCSFGTNLNGGSHFETPPHLPHGPYGIICGHDWYVGKQCIMYHQATLAGGGKIGDNVMHGAGVNVLDNVTIGNNKKIKVLHFIYGLHVGGAETFIINAITELDSDRFNFDFAIQNSEVTNPILHEMIATKRIRVYNIPRFPFHIAAQYKSLKNLLEVNAYDVVHIHMNAAVNPVPLLLSKIMCHKGIKFLVHSHNSSNNFGGKLGNLIHYFNSRILIDKNCEKVACSDLAGRWMFGNDDYEIIANAVNTTRYEFNKNSRTKIRRQLCISDDNVVIGNVGRFVHAKNHRFMIDFFANYSKTHPMAILLLVGAGPLFEETKSHVRNIGLDKRVIFTGLRTDIPELLSAMDCFLFPSIFEGLGFVAIEAEAAGLHVVASDTISTEINQRQYVQFLSLKDSYSNWATAIDSAVEQTRSSKREANPIKGSRFDIKKMKDKLETIYRN